MALRIVRHAALPALAALGLTLAPRVALADCPDGWFCDEAPATPAAEPSRPREPVEEPEEPEEPTAPTRRSGRIWVAPPDGYPPPPPPPHRRRQQLGLNLHLDIGVMGAGAQDDSWLGGAGFAFRLRPIPMFAVDLGLELIGGVDYNGNDRTEQAFVANALAFVNPRDRVQCFLLGGFSVGGAGVRVRRQGGYLVPPRDESYTYFGGQIGIGVEWRVSRRAAITSDFSLFARNRTDSGRELYPEYVDPSTHLATNASGGGLFRLGGTFYF
jgi:hypothetical protein